jgi:hypothetical protein
MTIWSALDLLVGLFCLGCALFNRGTVRYAFLLGALAACTDAFVYEDETPWLSWTLDIVFYGSMAVALFAGRKRRGGESPV